MQPTRSVRPFEVISEYSPSGDQPTAIAELAHRVQAGESDIVLLGGEGRLAYHGVDRIYPGTSTLLKNGGRINLTLRRVNP